MGAPKKSAKSSTGRYRVMAKLHHIGPNWKKGDRQYFSKGDVIELSDKEAEPLLALETIEATE